MPDENQMTPIPNSNSTAAYTGYITQITLPSGNKYEIVDEEGRKTITNVVAASTTNAAGIAANAAGITANATAITAVSTTVNTLQTDVNNLSTSVSALTNLSEYTEFLGVINTAVAGSILTDGCDIRMISIGNSTTASTTATRGAIVLQPIDNSSDEFIFDGEHWQLIGNLSINNLGNFARVNTAVATYTPLGTITSPTTTFSTNGQIALEGNMSINLLQPTTTTYIPAGTITFSPTVYNLNHINSITSTTPSEAEAPNYLTWTTTGAVTTTLTASSANVLSTVTINSTSDSADTNVAAIASVTGHCLTLLNISIDSTSISAINTIDGVTSTFNGESIYFKTSQSQFSIPQNITFEGTAADIANNATVSATIPVTSSNSATAIPIVTTGTLPNIQFVGTPATIHSVPYTGS